MTEFRRQDMLPCEIQKVWETVLAVERYHTWRRDVSRTEVIDDKRFIEYAGDGYTTTFTRTALEPHRRLELDMENDDIKGHWIFVLTSKGSETEMDWTASVTSKKLNFRPVGKGMFEHRYVQKEQTRFIEDLKSALDG